MLPAPRYARPRPGRRRQTRNPAAPRESRPGSNGKRAQPGRQIPSCLPPKHRRCSAARRPPINRRARPTPSAPCPGPASSRLAVNDASATKNRSAGPASGRRWLPRSTTDKPPSAANGDGRTTGAGRSASRPTRPARVRPVQARAKCVRRCAGQIQSPRRPPARQNPAATSPAWKDSGRAVRRSPSSPTGSPARRKPRPDCRLPTDRSTEAWQARGSSPPLVATGTNKQQQGIRTLHV